MRYGIIGGGVLGLTVALRLAQRGHDVEVLERDEVPGGLAEAVAAQAQAIPAHHGPHLPAAAATFVDAVPLLAGLDLDRRDQLTNGLLVNRGITIQAGHSRGDLLDRYGQGLAQRLLEIGGDRRLLGGAGLAHLRA